MHVDKINEKVADHVQNEQFDINGSILENTQEAMPEKTEVYTEGGTFDP